MPGKTNVRQSPARRRRSAQTNTIRPIIAFLSLVLVVGTGLVWLVYSAIANLSAGSDPAGRSAAKENWVHGAAGAAMTAIRGRPHPTMSDYFANLEDWISATVVSTSGERDAYGGGDWTCTATGAEPGAMRIWRNSLDLGDYDFAFRGRVTVGGLGCAFRASDSRNFCGIRLVPSGFGGVAQARIEHFVRAGGRLSERARTPLPFNVLERVEYNLSVKVRGDRFTVAIDGQFADSWTDSALKNGGIGFFSESGDGSVIRWVEVTERDSTLGRMLGYFAFATPWIGPRDPGP